MKKKDHFNSDLHICDFCKWLWCVYEQTHQTDESSTPDRKKFFESRNSCIAYTCHLNCFTSGKSALIALWILALGGRIEKLLQYMQGLCMQSF